MLLKIDVSNAFSCLRRDVYLEQARTKAPSLYNLFWQTYAQPSKLFFVDYVFHSTDGIQQADSFCSALFSFVVQPIAKNVNSEVNIWYLDDATIAGTEDAVLDDLRTLKTRLVEICQ